MRTAFVFLTATLTAFSMQTRPPARSACTTATSACTEWVALGGGTSLPGRSLIYRSHSLDARNDHITQAAVSGFTEDLVCPTVGQQVLSGGGTPVNHFFLSGSYPGASGDWITVWASDDGANHGSDRVEDSVDDRPEGLRLLVRDDQADDQGRQT